MQVKKESRSKKKEKKKKSLIQGCLAASISQAAAYYKDEI